MFCRGRIAWADQGQEMAEVWDGYTVFQVKQKTSIDSIPGKNAQWLWTQIRSELEQWADPDSGREPVPNYLVFVSNVPLTPTPDTGGLALVDAQIENFIESFDDASKDISPSTRRQREARRARLSRIRDWRIWDRIQIEAYLNVYAAVRRAFTALLTAQDVFSRITEFTDTLPVDELEPALRKHARAALVGERSIYFDEAGAGDSTGTPIEQIAIDLPITPASDGSRRTALGYILERAERILRPSLSLHEGPRHLVLAGAPGNGKTTLSKFVIQAYRAAFVFGDNALGTEHSAAVKATAEALVDLKHGGLPRHRRWPMRIDLAEYAKEDGLGQDSTLLRWIAHKISRRSNAGSVAPAALDAWMRQWPCILVLDGLDEVTEPSVRRRLIRQITEFVAEADADNWDLLVILTTRPMGYVENIAPLLFERIDLSRLQKTQAVSYGIKATRVRLRGDQDKVDRIESELRKAAEMEVFRNLIQTPLQVLIITIILEGAGRLTPDRYSLFWTYYDTVFKRERSKPLWSARLLQEHAPHILTLHQRVGFDLQVLSESAEGATATISLSRLRETAWLVLQEAGFRPSTADSGLLDQIVTAATHRLVLLAPREDHEEGFGFDVRSLQELMAARYIVTGTNERVAERLQTAAASPHWRNVWLFAAGSCFAEPQPHEHAALVELVKQVDKNASQRLGLVCPVGPALALELVDDGMARAHPRFYDELLVHGLGILSLPSPSDPLSIARALVRAADVADRNRTAIADALRNALAGSPVSQETAEEIRASVGTAGREAGATLHAMGLGDVRAIAVAGLKRASASPENHWDRYRDTLLLAGTSGKTAEVLATADSVLRHIHRHGNPGTGSVTSILAAIRDSEASEILEIALEEIAQYEPRLIRQLRDGLLTEIYRAPIGELIR